jgi:hypothetical protein
LEESTQHRTSEKSSDSPLGTQSKIVNQTLREKSLSRNSNQLDLVKPSNSDNELTNSTLTSTSAISISLSFKDTNVFESFENVAFAEACDPENNINETCNSDDQSSTLLESCHEECKSSKENIAEHKTDVQEYPSLTKVTTEDDPIKEYFQEPFTEAQSIESRSFTASNTFNEYQDIIEKKDIEHCIPDKANSANTDGSVELKNGYSFFENESQIELLSLRNESEQESRVLYEEAVGLAGEPSDFEVVWESKESTEQKSDAIHEIGANVGILNANAREFVSQCLRQTNYNNSVYYPADLYYGQHVFEPVYSHSFNQQLQFDENPCDVRFNRQFKQWHYYVNTFKRR